MKPEWKKFFKDYGIVCSLITIFGAFAFAITSSAVGSTNWNPFFIFLPIAYVMTFSLAIGLAVLTGSKE